ncbi:MAG: hypothetical protein Q7S83_01460 [bacterium]|nr:hypothetical protein [bacterium]
MIMARKKYDPTKRKQARGLREHGFSFKGIAQELGIAKSTARLWCRGIELSVQQKEWLYKKGLIAMHNSPNNSHERRQREIKKIAALAEKEIKIPISDDVLRLLGAVIYWAEGNKTKDFGVTNSDPLLIKFMIGWMIKMFGVTTTDLKAHLNIYSQQNDSDIKKFWSDLTGIPLENFGKSFVKPANKGFKKNNLYYGTIKIRMMKGGDSMQRVFAWLKKMLSSLDIAVDKVETRWNKLKSYKRDNS